jgi:hypothetical protein
MPGFFKLSLYTFLLAVIFVPQYVAAKPPKKSYLLRERNLMGLENTNMKSQLSSSSFKFFRENRYK